MRNRENLLFVAVFIPMTLVLIAFVSVLPIGFVAVVGCLGLEIPRITKMITNLLL